MEQCVSSHTIFDHFQHLCYIFKRTSLFVRLRFKKMQISRVCNNTKISHIFNYKVLLYPFFGVEVNQGCHAPIKTKFPVFSLSYLLFPCVFSSTKNKIL